MPTLASPGRLMGAHGRGPADSGGDPLFANVQLLLEFEGEDAATATTDVSTNGHTVTFNGDAQIDTAQADVGDSSLLLDGTGDFVTVAHDAGFVPGTGPFCFECSFRPAALQDIELFGFYDGAGSNQLFTCAINIAGGGAGLITVWTTDSFTETFASDLTFAIDTWYKLRVERAGDDTLRILLDGVVVGSAENTQDLSGGSPAFRLGGGFMSSAFNGHIDHLRYTTAERDGGAYTPSTDPFPTS
jgi:hypothetical protein